jgi:hypothetical protein
VLDNSKINIKFLPIHGLTFSGKGSFVAGKNVVIYGWSGLTAPGISKTGALIASNPSQTMVYLRPTGFMDKTKSGGLTKYGQIVSASIGADFNGRIYFSNATSLNQFQLNRLRFYVDPSVDYTSPYNYFSSTQAASFELLANDTIKTEPVDVLPVSTLTTSSVASITNISATSGGNITDASGDAVIARGVVWSTTSSPTIDLSTKTVNGAGTGTFTSSITGLSPGTLYYVRAYATNSNGTDYGSQLSFTTLTPPSLTSTTTPTSVTASSASSGGNISSANGYTMQTRGVVWSTSPNPTIALSTKTVENSSSIGSFTANITGLTGLTLYYVRSYATNTSGTDYGPEITFTTPYAPDGSNSTNAAVSGAQLRADYPSLSSGWYWIKSASMPNAIEMYVDMVEDGGGYDFHFITAGPSVSTVTETNGGTALGLDLVMPRSKNHWKAMSNAVLAGVARGSTKVGSGTYASFFLTAYGVYRNTTTTGGSYTSYIMRHSSFGGTNNAPDWRVKDGGRWWLRDNTYGEPNGDYGLNGLLGGGGLPNPYSLTDINFNDLTSNYSTGNYYLVSTNSKQ